MSKEQHLVLKGQANAVREYLASIGMELTHVQALEVIARGQGLRSRHVLAHQAHGEAACTASQASQRLPAVAGGAPSTRVSYRYTDGANCKRASSIVFRGRLHPQQLQLIARKLDDGLYFVPCQVGFESLQLAFTDEGGDDHGWHTMELGEPADWVLDAQGFVLAAGDVQQVHGAHEFATDADCDNLFWRFARIVQWDPAMQEEVLHRHAYRRPMALALEAADSDFERRAADIARQLVDNTASDAPSFAGSSRQHLHTVVRLLLEDGFDCAPQAPHRFCREVAPNALQECELSGEGVGPQAGEGAGLRLDWVLRTRSGKAIVESQCAELRPEREGDLCMLEHRLSEQLKVIRVLPVAYDSTFEN